MARTRKRFLDLPGNLGLPAVSVAGVVLVILVCWLAPIPVQIGSVGILVVFLLSLTVARRQLPTLPHEIDLFSGPIALARDKQVFEFYQSITKSLECISADKDPIYRGLALERTSHYSRELAELAKGRIIFTGTETWRMAYARLLRSQGLHLYRSVAHVRTSSYWQDEPGRQSMQVNLEMVDGETLSIERIAIFPDHLWPAGERFPVEPLCQWIDEQYNHGIWVKLVRQSTLAGDPDLIVDLGIYGNRAVGVQELDDQGRTVRFTLSFSFPEVLAAERRWERLSVYSTSYQKLLDQSARPG